MLASGAKRRNNTYYLPFTSVKIDLTLMFVHKLGNIYP
jgi:hypothetical protein